MRVLAAALPVALALLVATSAVAIAPAALFVSTYSTDTLRGASTLPPQPQQLTPVRIGAHLHELETRLRLMIVATSGSVSTTTNSISITTCGDSTNALFMTDASPAEVERVLQSLWFTPTAPTTSGTRCGDHAFHPPRVDLWLELQNDQSQVITCADLPQVGVHNYPSRGLQHHLKRISVLAEPASVMVSTDTLRVRSGEEIQLSGLTLRVPAEDAQCSLLSGQQQRYRLSVRTAPAKGGEVLLRLSIRSFLSAFMHDQPFSTTSGQSTGVQVEATSDYIRLALRSLRYKAPRGLTTDEVRIELMPIERTKDADVQITRLAVMVTHAAVTVQVSWKNATLFNVSQVIEMDEDTTLSLSAISVEVPSNDALEDLDVNVTVAASHGRFEDGDNLSSHHGGVFTRRALDATAIEVSGPLRNISRFLQQLVYVPNQNYNGPDAIVISTTQTSPDQASRVVIQPSTELLRVFLHPVEDEVDLKWTEPQANLTSMRISFGERRYIPAVTIVDGEEVSDSTPFFEYQSFLRAEIATLVRSGVEVHHDAVESARQLRDGHEYMVLRFEAKASGLMALLAGVKIRLSRRIWTRQAEVGVVLTVARVSVLDDSTSMQVGMQLLVTIENDEASNVGRILRQRLIDVQEDEATDLGSVFAWESATMPSVDVDFGETIITVTASHGQLASNASITTAVFQTSHSFQAQSLEDVKNILSQLKYAPDRDYAGVDELVVSIGDQMTYLWVQVLPENDLPTVVLQEDNDETSPLRTFVPPIVVHDPDASDLLTLQASINDRCSLLLEDSTSLFAAGLQVEGLDAMSWELGTPILTATLTIHGSQSALNAFLSKASSIEIMMPDDPTDEAPVLQVCVSDEALLKSCVSQPVHVPRVDSLLLSPYEITPFENIRPIPVSSFFEVHDNAMLNETVVMVRLKARLGIFETANTGDTLLPCGRSIERRLDSNEPSQVHRELTGAWGCMRELVSRTTYHGTHLSISKPTVDEVGVEVVHRGRRVVNQAISLTLLPPMPRFQLSLTNLGTASSTNIGTANASSLAEPAAWRWTRARPVMLHDFVEMDITPTTASNTSSEDDPIDDENRLLKLNVSCSASCLLSYNLDANPAVPNVDYSFSSKLPSHVLQFFGIRRSLVRLLQTLEIRVANSSDAIGVGYLEVALAETGDSIHASSSVSDRVQFRFEIVEPPLEWRVTQESYVSNLGSDFVSIDGVGLAADSHSLQLVRVMIECDSNAPIVLTIDHPAVRVVDRSCGLFANDESIEVTNSLVVVNDILRNVQIKRRTTPSIFSLEELVTIRFGAVGDDPVDDNASPSMVDIQVQFRPAVLGDPTPLQKRLSPVRNTTLALDEDSALALGAIFIFSESNRDDTQLYRMTAAVSHGALEVLLNDVCCVNILSPSSTPRLVIESTLPALKDALAAVLYKPQPEFSGMDLLKISIEAEEQHPSTWTYDTAIHVRPVNDAPRIAVLVAGTQMKQATDSQNHSLTFYQTEVSIELSDADIAGLLARNPTIQHDSEADPSLVQVRLLTTTQTAAIVLPRWNSLSISLTTVSSHAAQPPFDSMSHITPVRSVTFEAPLETANALLNSVLYVSTTSGSRDRTFVDSEDIDRVDGELLEVYVNDLGHGVTTWQPAEATQSVSIRSEASIAHRDALALTLPAEHTSFVASERTLTISGLSITGLNDGTSDVGDLDHSEDGSVVQVTGTAAFRVVPEVQRIRLLYPEQIQVFTVVLAVSGGVAVAPVTGTFQLQTTDPETGLVNSATVHAQAVAMRVDEVVGNEETGRGRDESMEAKLTTLLIPSAAKIHVVKTVADSAVTWRIYATANPTKILLPALRVATTALGGVGVGGAATISSSSEIVGASLGGSFALRLGHEETRRIDADATALQVQDALEELPSVSVVEVKLVGAHVFDIAFFQPGANVPLLEADTSTLTPIATVSDAAWPTVTSIGANVQITRATEGIGQGSVYVIDVNGTHVSPVYRVAVSRSITTLGGGSFALSFRLDATRSVLATTDPIAFDAVAMMSDEAVLTQEGGRVGNSMESKLLSAIKLLPQRHWSAVTRLVVSRASTSTPQSFVWTITFVDAPSDFPSLVATVSTAQPVQARLMVSVLLLTPANTVGGSFTLSFRGQTTAALPVSATAAVVEDSMNALDAVRNGSTTFGRVIVRRKEVRSVGSASFAVLFVEQIAVSSQETSLLVADGGSLTGIGAFARVRSFQASPWGEGSWVFPGLASVQAILPTGAWSRGVQFRSEPSHFALISAAADVRVWLQQFTYMIPREWCCGYASVVIRAQRVVDTTSNAVTVRTDERLVSHQTRSRVAVYTPEMTGLSHDLVTTRGHEHDVDFLRIATPSSMRGLLWLSARLRVSFGTVRSKSRKQNATLNREVWLNGSAEAVNASIAQVQYTSPRSSEYKIDILSIEIFAAVSDQLLTRSEFLIRIDEPPFEPRIAVTNGADDAATRRASDDDTPLELRGISIVDANVAAGVSSMSPASAPDIIADLLIDAQLGQLELTRSDGLLRELKEPSGALVLRGSVLALNDALLGLRYRSSRVYIHARDSVTFHVSYEPDDRPLLYDTRKLDIDIQHAVRVPHVAIASSNAATYAAKEDDGYLFPNLTISRSKEEQTIRPAQLVRRIPVTELRRTNLSPPLVTKLPITSPDDDPRHRWVADLPGLSLCATSARSFAAFSAAPSRFFFTGANRTYGEELWTSDGSANGTQLLVDLMPGTASGSPSDFAVLPPNNNRVLFAADGVDRSWTLNTEKACNRERTSSTASDLMYVVAASPTWAPSASYDCPGLGWRWATTDEGSARFRDDGVAPANLSEPYVFWGHCDWNGFVFGGVTRKHFRFADSVVTGALKHGGRRDSAPLEVSFSTTDFAGIVCIRDESTAQTSAAGRELWVSDGSAAFGATKRLADINPGPRGSDPKFLTPFQSRWFVFQATTDGVGSELFKTDGTAAGTVLIEDIWRGPRSSRPSDFAEWTGGGDGRLYFAATTESGRELWSTDGLSSVTVERGRRTAAATSGVLIGTALVRDICASPTSAGSSDPQFLTPLGALGVFFAATDCVNGRELWVTDGTFAGTKMVKDINTASGVGSDPSHFTAFNGKLYFAATASAAAMDRELFVSDGTTAGTLLLAELVPGVASATPTLLTVANAKLYFHAIDAQGFGNIWVSDGTAVGTTPVWDAPFAQSHVLRSASAASISASTGLNDKFFVLNNALYYFTERRWTGADVPKVDDIGTETDQGDVFQLQITVSHGTISIPPDHPIALTSQAVNDTRLRLRDVLRRLLYHPPLNWNVLQSAGDHVVRWNFTVSSSASQAVETTTADLIVRLQLDPPVILVPTAVEHATTSERDYLSRLRLECLPITVLEDVPTPLRGFSVRGIDDLDGAKSASWELELSVSRGRLSVSAEASGCVRTVTSGRLVDTKRVVVMATRVACLRRLLGALTYTSDPHVSGADALVIRVRAAVGGVVPSMATIDAQDTAVVPIVVTEVNDAPFLTPTPSGFFYDAEEDYALIIKDLHVDDPDAAVGQRVRVDMRARFGAIALLSRGAAGISIEQTDAASWAPASSTRLVFSGLLGDVNAALSSAAYTSAPNWNSLAHANENDGYDVVSIVLSDGQAFNASTSAQLYVFVAPTPDPVLITPPVVRATSVYVALARDDGVLHGDEDQWLETTGLGFTSEDDTTRSTLDVTLRVSHGRLAFDETLLRSSGVSIAGSTSDGSLWRLRGRFALVNRSVAALRYLPFRDFNGADALDITASAVDDYESQRSIQTTRVVAITVHAVNDPPQWTLPVSRLSWRQDGSTRIAGVKLDDVDADVALMNCGGLACEWEIVVEVTGSGSLTLPHLESSPIYASATNYVVLSGTLAELNRVLREIALRTEDLDSAVREPVEVWFTADDRGNFGSGGPQVARQRLTVLPFQWTRHPLELFAPQDDVLTMDEDGELIFNGLIALRDRDTSTRATAVSPQYEVTIESRHGRFRLATSAFSAARLLVIPTTTARVLRVRGFLPQLNVALNGSAYIPDADWFGSERIDITARQLADDAEPANGDDKSDDDAMTATVAVFVAPVCDAPRWQNHTQESQRDLQADIVLDEDGQVLVTSLVVDDPDVLVADGIEENDFHRELSVAIDVHDGGGVKLATTRGLRITDDHAPIAWPSKFAATRLLFFSRVVLTGRTTELNAALRGLTFRPQPDFHTNGHVRDAITLRVFAPTGACTSSDDLASTTMLRAQVLPVNDAPRVVSSRFQQVSSRDIVDDVIHRSLVPTQDASTDLPLTLDAVTLQDADVMDDLGEEEIPRPEANFRLRVSCRSCSVATSISLETLQQTHGLLASQEVITRGASAAEWGSSSTTYYAPIATLNAVVLASLVFTSAPRFAGRAVVLLEISDLGFFGRKDGGSSTAALETAFAMVVRVRRMNSGPQILVPPFGTRAPPLEVDEGASVLLQGAPPLPPLPSPMRDGESELPTWQLLFVDPLGVDSPSRVRSLLGVTSTVNPRLAVSSVASLSPSQIVFSAFNVSSGSELWTSDGTASGTRLLKNLAPGGSSSEPRFLTRFSVDGRVYFAAHGLDADAWRLRPELRDACDGMRESAFAPGVFFVVAQDTAWDVDAAYDCPAGLRWMTTAEAARVFVGTEPHGDEQVRAEPLVYFGQCGWDAFTWGGQQRAHFRFADSSVTGAFKHAGHRDSYRTDVDFQSQQFAGIVCRERRSGDPDDEGYVASTTLWATDGTTEGTHRVTSTLSQPGHVAEFQGELFLQATTRAYGAELWATAGSRASTQFIADVAFGTHSSAPEQLTVSNGKLFFSAATDAAGRELRVSDGNPRSEFAQVDHGTTSTTGTRLVLDIRVGAASSTPRFLTALPAAGLLLFQADDGVHGAELWASDGSASGTLLVLDIRSGARGSEPRFLTHFNGRVFFQADDGVHGAELWVTDGSAAGTQLLSDLVPGARGAAPRYLAVLRLASFSSDVLVFAAASDRDASVVEFWTSDSSSAGTQKLFAGSREVVTVNDAAMDDDTRLMDSSKRLVAVGGGFVVIGRTQKQTSRSTKGEDVRVVVSRSLTLVDDDDDDEEEVEDGSARTYRVNLQSERGGLLRLSHRHSCRLEGQPQDQDQEATQAVTLRGSLSTLNCLVAQVVYEAAMRGNGTSSNSSNAAAVMDGWDDAVVVTLSQETDAHAFSATQRVRVRVVAHNRPPIVEMPARVFAPLDAWISLPAIGVRDDDAGTTARLLLRVSAQRGRVRLAGSDVPDGVTLLATSAVDVDARSGAATLELAAALSVLNALLGERRLVEYACQRALGCDADTGDVVAVTVDDNGFSGRGGALSTTQTARVSVVAS